MVFILAYSCYTQWMDILYYQQANADAATAGRNLHSIFHILVTSHKTASNVHPFLWQFASQSSYDVMSHPRHQNPELQREIYYDLIGV